ncbi:yeats family protein [Stylonychia lemnae]|uniref:Yeats family protein n=1 Tax=Stylonychia lemnae TaxID=5949 RepID=A0A078B1G4_STYLE|nr:yeats family protein [Stylonychia lemnae]|eukprot:CDW88400.1 yeats family protein [Stylonychia lemnae]
MVEPCTLPCKHIFCIQCINQQIMNKTQCPMCRQDFQQNYLPQIDTDLQSKIKLKYPQKFEERNEELKQQGLLEGNLVKVKFMYGNDHKLIPNPKKLNSQHLGEEIENKHTWTVFVRIVKSQGQIIGNEAKKFISKVKFGLHPTFGATEQTVQQEPFQMTKIGWGTFEVPIEIHFRRETGKRDKVTLSHYLSFNGHGETKWFTVTFDKEKLEQMSI